MPLFLDSHRGTELPPDTIRDFMRAASRGAQDEFGVRPLDLYCGDDGDVHYAVAAPDETAIRQSHAAHGADCSRIRHIATPPGSRLDLGEREKALVRRLIMAQHGAPGLTGIEAEA
jgi:hypothetical protein